jgi:hypothetical protein
VSVQDRPRDEAVAMGGDMTTWSDDELRRITETDDGYNPHA